MISRFSCLSQADDNKQRGEYVRFARKKEKEMLRDMRS